MTQKYDRIGAHYNHTRRADPYLASQLIWHVDSARGGVFLDIGCGTGNYTHALAKSGMQMIGIDPSSEMLRKANSGINGLQLVRGKAEALPFAERSFSGSIATLTTHHWEDLSTAFHEVHRVTEAGGKFVIFTSTPEQMKGYWLNEYFPAMLARSMLQMSRFEELQGTLGSAGFTDIASEKYFVRKDLEDSFLYSRKHDPESYLDDRFRKGISSFSDLVDEGELSSGLDSLRKDIDSGRIEKVAAKYENTKGDYLFVISTAE